MFHRLGLPCRFRYGDSMTAADPLLPIHCSLQLWGTEPVQIQSWLVVPGEEVWPGDVLVELGLPGISGDVRSVVHGYVREIRQTEGTWITADVVLGWMERIDDLES